MHYTAEGTANLRALADQARARQLQTVADAPDDPAALAYAQGVEDVLRYAVGDAAPTDELRRLLESKEQPADIDACTCVFSCADDPATMCSHSGEFHVHPDSGACPLHPDAPGDL